MARKRRAKWRPRWSTTGETQPEAVDSCCNHDRNAFPDHEVDHRKIREIHQDLQARHVRAFYWDDQDVDPCFDQSSHWRWHQYPTGTQFVIESSGSAAPGRSIRLTVNQASLASVTSKGNHLYWLLSVARYPPWCPWFGQSGGGYRRW